ncbi:hypothetical protein, partial [Sedimenticola sp.]|uniref:hypothetical protein n=1 Tax=Sedimenticola sp. TaxID=1940285 RepID=UPI002FFB4BA8|nr:hypothetical protein [Sedimenticola sp.]
RALIPLLAAVALLLPTWVAAQHAVEDNTVSAIDPVLVRQGDFAILLLEALSLGEVDTEEEATRRLGAIDIAPDEGWIADYPVTPEILAELALTIGDAADTGKIGLNRDKAMETLQALAAELGLYIPDEFSPRYARRYLLDDAYDCSGSTIRHYYDNYGPPVMSYCRPPYDYDYLYDWRPYGSWWHGHYYPGYYLLHRFHLVIHVDSKRPHHRRHLVKPQAKSRLRHEKTGPHAGVRHLSNRNKPGKEWATHRRDHAAKRTGERQQLRQRDYPAKQDLRSKRRLVEKGTTRELQTNQHHRANRAITGRPRAAPDAAPGQRNTHNRNRGNSPDKFRFTEQQRMHPEKPRVAAKSAKTGRQNLFANPPGAKRPATTKSIPKRNQLGSGRRQPDVLSSRRSATLSERSTQQRRHALGRPVSPGRQNIRPLTGTVKKQPLRSVRKHPQGNRAVTTGRAKKNHQHPTRIKSRRSDNGSMALQTQTRARPSTKAQRQGAGRLSGERTSKK